MDYQTNLNHIIQNGKPVTFSDILPLYASLFTQIGCNVVQYQYINDAGHFQFVFLVKLKPLIITHGRKKGHVFKFISCQMKDHIIEVNEIKNDTPRGFINRAAKEIHYFIRKHI